ncbi:MAG: hypothetical protein JRH20_18815 [Deltaproteobacteria bacterium]|nr:hypothetical protein [Deltaproteobacteria bacterium]
MTEEQKTPEKTPDRGMSLGMRVALLVALLAVVVGGLMVLWQVSGKPPKRLVSKQMVAKPRRVLKRLLKKQTRLLAADEVSDEARGKYRIPVTRAMQILVKNPSLIAPLPKPEVTSAPATQPAPAPSPAPSPAP